MTKNKIIYIIAIVLVLIIIGGGLFFFLGNIGAQKKVGVKQGETIVDCSKEDILSNAKCFSDRMFMCLPVTWVTTTAARITVAVTILGLEDGKCNFERKINNIVDLNCYFSEEAYKTGFNLIAQTLGMDRNLQNLIDTECVWQNSN